MNDTGSEIKPTEVTADMIGALVSVKAYGRDKKGLLFQRMFTARLEALTDDLVLLADPDEPPLPGRKGKRYALQRGCIDSIQTTEHCGLIKAEALKGLAHLHLSHPDGSTAYFGRQYNGMFRAVLPGRVLYAKRGEDLLVEVEQMGYEVTSWGWENQRP